MAEELQTIITERYPKGRFDRKEVTCPKQVLHKRNRNWRLQCRRMKQIRSLDEYNRIREASQDDWVLADEPDNITVQYSRRVNGPDKPTDVILLFADIWKTLKQLKKSPYKAFKFFQHPPRGRLSRVTVPEWTPNQSLTNFRFDQISEGKFVHVSARKFLELYKVQWPKMRIKPQYFRHFTAYYQQIRTVFGDAIRQYIRDGGLFKSKFERQVLRQALNNGDEYDIVELNEPAVLANEMPLPEGQLALNEMEERVEPVDQVEANQNLGRVNQFAIRIVEFMDMNDDEPGELVIDMDQDEEEEQQQLDQFEIEVEGPDDLDINLGELGLEMEQNEPRENGPPMLEYDPNPMADFVPVNQAIAGHGQIEQQMDRQVDQYAALQVPVIAPERQGLGHLRRERGRGRQRQRLILRRIAEQRHRLRARRGRLAPGFVPIEAADDQHAEFAGLAIDLPNGQFGLGNIEELVQERVIGDRQPLVNVLPEIEPPLNQMELHNAEDIGPRAEIERRQPLVNVLPEIEPPLNQMELHNAEDIGPRAEIEPRQPLVNDLPQNLNPEDFLGLENAEFNLMDLEVGELVINNFNDGGLMDQFHFENLVNVGQDPPMVLVNGLLRNDEPEVQVGHNNHDEIDQQAGQLPHEMEHQPIAPVLPVIEPEQFEQPMGPQIDQQAGQEPPPMAPEPMDDVNQVNLPQQNELAIEYQIVQPAAQLNNPIDEDEPEEELARPQYNAYFGLMSIYRHDPDNIHVEVCFFHDPSPPSDSESDDSD